MKSRVICQILAKSLGNRIVGTFQNTNDGTKIKAFYNYSALFYAIKFKCVEKLPSKSIELVVATKYCKAFQV